MEERRKVLLIKSLTAMIKATKRVIAKIKKGCCEDPTDSDFDLLIKGLTRLKELSHD